LGLMLVDALDAEPLPVGLEGDRFPQGRNVSPARLHGVKRTQPIKELGFGRGIADLPQKLGIGQHAAQQHAAGEPCAFRGQVASPDWTEGGCRGAVW
jgi:hypothetical protein